MSCAQDGSSVPEALTTGGKAMRYAPEWSADGSRIAFGDKDGKVFVLTVAEKKLVEVNDAVNGQIRDYVWSPRGNHLAFSDQDHNGNSSIYVWSASDGKLRRVDHRDVQRNQSAWDPQGNYLYFLSQREFAPLISQIEFNFAANRSTGIFALSLRKRCQTSVPGGEGRSNDYAKPTMPAKPKAPETPPAGGDLTIDFDGIEKRVARVPVDADNYGNLTAKTGFLLYNIGPSFYYGRQGERPPSLRLYSIKDRKETNLGDGIGGFALSRDGSKVIVRRRRWLPAFRRHGARATSKETSLTTGLVVDRVPAEEWNQIFNEVWRRYRDWFYVPTMHGYDWEAIRKQYEPLLKHVAHRSDLNYVIGEMISELTVQHAYIEGGDFQIPPRPRVALPGARFELGRTAGRFKISKIFEGQNEEDIYRSPLTEIGVGANVGDYVLAINGEDLRANDDPYRLLRNKADGPVQLTVNSRPTMEGSRTISFRANH
jgi:tricorn protease